MPVIRMQQGSNTDTFVFQVQATEARLQEFSEACLEKNIKSLFVLAGKKTYAVVVFEISSQKLSSMQRLQARSS